MDKILLAISNERNSALLSKALEKEHEVLELKDKSGWDTPFDLCIADERALERNYGTVLRIKEEQNPVLIPLLLITSHKQTAIHNEKYWKITDELLLAPIEPIELHMRIRILLRMRKFSKMQEEYRNLLNSYNRNLEDEVSNKTNRLRENYIETIDTLVKASEFHDEGTGKHIERVGYYCRTLSEKLGMAPDFSDRIFYAARMHDVGKIGIPDTILLKNGKLNDSEWEIVKTHPTIGSNMLANVKSPYLKMGQEIALTHHERWDGSGYPNGLAGEEIPISGRIMNICDQYDALRSPRPYKPSLSAEEVREIITVGDGRTKKEHFDPQVLDVFSRSERDFDEIYRLYEE